jgi:hypothetical protein
MSGFPFQGYPVYLDGGALEGFVNSAPTYAAAVSSTRPDDLKVPADPRARVRRQNRSCDQCRKGKRKCDAVVLRGWSADDSNVDQPSGASPLLIVDLSECSAMLNITTAPSPQPCTYCVKTSKNCTFEWLKALELGLRAKKEASQDSGSLKRIKTERSQSTADSVDSDFPSTRLGVGSSKSPSSLASSLASPRDNPRFDNPHFDLSQFSVYTADPKALPWDSLNYLEHQHLEAFPTVSSTGGVAPVAQAPFAPDPHKDLLAFEDDLHAQGLASCLVPVRKRRLLEHGDESSETFDEPGLVACRNVLIDTSPSSLTSRLTAATTATDVSKGLLRVYHDSMENALSCWLNARTCPYVSSPKGITDSGNSESLQQIWSPDFSNRIIQRVLSLDRVAGKIRNRPLTQSEGNAASNAMNLAIIAFATQWAQASKRSREAHRSSLGSARDLGESTHHSTVTEFDRRLQEQYWHEARQAVLECADVESFKAIFASMVFSLAQRPINAERQAEIRRDAAILILEHRDTVDFDALEEMVERIIEEDGPPVHLERGVRFAHSLRHRLRRLEREAEKSGQGEPVLPDEHRQAVDMVAWLGYMLESLTSAMYQRPLVVSDEDSDILPESMEALNLDDDDFTNEEEPRKPSASKLWDDFLFLQEKSNRRGQPPLSYPCTYHEAAAGLSDAAPIKVLLFRKIAQLQRLVARGGPPAAAADTERDAMRVYWYWRRHYEPFLRACAANHDALPPRIQSWYICISAHWHLAGLMLADAVEAAAAAIPPETPRSPVEGAAAAARAASLRRHDAAALADLARCATPRPDATFATSDRFHAAVSASALLSEAWTELLVRAFAKAALRLLREAAAAAASLRSSTAGLVSIAAGVPVGGVGPEELARRCDWCVGALKFLGRKSDVARLVGDALGMALVRGTAGWGDGDGVRKAADAAVAAVGGPVWFGGGEGLGPETMFGPSGTDDGAGLWYEV